MKNKKGLVMKIFCKGFIKPLYLALGMVCIGMFSINQFAISNDEDIVFGVVSDIHYADRDTAGQRHYRDSIAKTRAMIKDFNKIKPSFIIELGDYVDKGETLEAELSYLKRIEEEYNKFEGEKHYVIGNHDVATFSKKQFIENSGATKNYYSFDKSDFHFIVLDACYNEDGSDYNAGNFQWTETYIPAKEQEWLKKDLNQTDKTAIAFIHQRLDADEDPHNVKNAEEVRKILEDSGKVLAVFQGHDHRGAYNNINGVHYITVKSMVDGPGVENKAYITVHITEDQTIKIKGFGKMENQEIPRPDSAKVE
ncbi:alkaline phosphatase [Candidatus Poribacteria bacterium]|nr:alkaline phosphatase [Candidatus Poribacteria bacterium]